MERSTLVHPAIPGSGVPGAALRLAQKQVFVQPDHLSRLVESWRW
jgi:hypothetical protein